MPKKKLIVVISTIAIFCVAYFFFLLFKKYQETVAFNNLEESLRGGPFRSSEKKEPIDPLDYSAALKMIEYDTLYRLPQLRKLNKPKVFFDYYEIDYITNQTRILDFINSALNGAPTTGLRLFFAFGMNYDSTTMIYDQFAIKISIIDKDDKAIGQTSLDLAGNWSTSHSSANYLKACQVATDNGLINFDPKFGKYGIAFKLEKSITWIQGAQNGTDIYFTPAFETNSKQGNGYTTLLANRYKDIKAMSIEDFATLVPSDWGNQGTACCP